MLRRSAWVLLVLLAILVPGGSGRVGPLQPVLRWSPYPEIAARGYVCYRATGAITIDGKLTDAAWAAAPWSEDFLDIEGDKKPRPRHRTRMKMLWDDQYLYIAAHMDEPDVWATLTRHDSVIFHDNDFEVFLDPDSDSHLYAELELNALNTTWDLLLSKPYKDGGRAIDAWEIPGLKTAVFVDGTLNNPRDTDRSWSVEIAWPLASLREISYGGVPPRDGTRWRINFSRVQWHHEVVAGKYRKVKGKAEDNWVWSPQGVIDMHRPERWGELVFSTAKPGSVTFQPDPARSARHTLHRVLYRQRDHRHARGRWARSLRELELGDLGGRVELETAGTTWEASIIPANPEKTRWRIRADGRVWQE